MASLSKRQNLRLALLMDSLFIWPQWKVFKSWVSPTPAQLLRVRRREPQPPRLTKKPTTLEKKPRRTLLELLCNSNCRHNPCDQDASLFSLPFILLTASGGTAKFLLRKLYLRLRFEPLTLEGSSSFYPLRARGQSTTDLHLEQNANLTTTTATTCAKLSSAGFLEQYQLQTRNLHGKYGRSLRSRHPAH
nr:hypothetical protein HmN_000978100 [Hymenolepis microstoma]